MSQLVVGYNCLDDSGCVAIGLQMNETHEHFNYVHNMQVQVHPHNPPLGDTTNTKCSQSRGRTSHGPCPRSSQHHASHPHPLSKSSEVNSFPNPLSLSHPALSHTHGSNFSVWIQFLSGTQFSTKCLNLKFLSEHAVHIISSLLCDPSVHIHAVALYLAENHSIENHLHKSFPYEGVCAFVFVHHDPGCYSGTGDLVNQIGCLHHETRVPED